MVLDLELIGLPPSTRPSVRGNECYCSCFTVLVSTRNNPCLNLSKVSISDEQLYLVLYFGINNYLVTHWRLLDNPFPTCSYLDKIEIQVKEFLIYFNGISYLSLAKILLMILTFFQIYHFAYNTLNLYLNWTHKNQFLFAKNYAKCILASWSVVNIWLVWNI